MVLLAAPISARAQDERPLVLTLSAEGPITPAMAEYLARGIHSAEDRGAELIVFQLNTPGGGVEVMNKMVQSIRGSKVPVVIFITPPGAMAGSAGTVITLAGHVAAMAPETAIGAASPVGAEGQELGETMEVKTKNILKATVRSLAEKRGEKAIHLAEQTIETAEAASASEALQAGLVDFVARDLDELLVDLNGFTVKMFEGDMTLNTANAVAESFKPSPIEQLLNVLTNPGIVFLLISIGVQAVLIEISSPGGWAAGFIGVVCLALAGYGLGVLPVNWFGIIFLITAFILFLLDIKAPTHGALTAAGVLSLIVGAMVLFNSPSVPNFQRVPLPLIIGVSMASGAVFFVFVVFAVRAQHLTPRTGMESVKGKTGVARSDISPNGIVQLGGEQWTAELAPGEPPVPEGARVQVVEIQGVKILVRLVK